jgi:hypothetical protein
MPQTYIVTGPSEAISWGSPLTVSWRRTGPPVPGTTGRNGEGHEITA